MSQPRPDPDHPTGPAMPSHDDTVTRNRETPRRRALGRDPTGWPVTLALIRMTVGILVVATLALALALLAG